MDTISRENNSMLPAIGVVVGAVALIISAYAAFNISKVKTELAAHDAKLAQIPDDIASQVSAVSAKADKVQTDMGAMGKSIQSAFDDVANRIATIATKVTTMEESQKRPAHGGKGGGGPVVAGPDEYIVKPGDNLSKIARANGATVSELEAVNPGVKSKSLKIGQKLKLPQKSAAPAPAPEAPAAPAPAPTGQ